MATMKTSSTKRPGVIERLNNRVGPRQSLPAYKREPADEQVSLPGGPPDRRLRTLAPIPKTALKERVGAPDKARYERGMTVSMLMRKQPRYVVNSSEDIVLKTYKKAKTKGGMPALIGLARDLNVRPQRIHKFQVIGLDKANPKVGTQKRVKVSCSCEFFLYYCEYALWTWGAASIRYSNGQPAVVRNPGNHPLICKHLMKVLETIKQHGD